MAPWKLNPVFVYECALAARRWQTYAARTAFVGALLISLIVVWIVRTPYSGVLNRNALAAIGESFFFAIAGTQLALALLAAPAYTAASICVDRARGTLAHMLVTDLSSAEIVAGKLGARGLPMFGLLLASLPVLVLTTLLGGIEPEAVAGSFIVTVAVALVCCTLALTLSVWVHKPHEVLIATYVIEAVWLLAMPLWHELNRTRAIPHDWLEIMNPFVLVCGAYVWPGGAAFDDYALFIGVCIALSAGLTLLATLALRGAAQPPAARARKRWRIPLLAPFRPALDFNPVLWREWRHRSASRWMQVIWGLYVLGCLGASATALGTGNRGEFAAFVNAFQFSIGLLLVSITGVASLFEERVSGSLDILLVTPLPVSTIVWGKWLASFRLVALVALLPGLLGFCVFFESTALALDEPQTGQLLLLLALMFAYGALVNGLGLALATWIPRFGVAMGITVAAVVLVAAGPVLLLLAANPGMDHDTAGLLCLSPWWGVGQTTALIRNDHRHISSWQIFWIIVYLVAAGTLLAATQSTFDRCLGRVSFTRAKRQPRGAAETAPPFC